MFKLGKYVIMSIYYLAIQMLFGVCKYKSRILCVCVCVCVNESVHFRQHAAVKAIDKYLFTVYDIIPSIEPNFHYILLVEAARMNFRLSKRLLIRDK